MSDGTEGKTGVIGRWSRLKRARLQAPASTPTPVAEAEPPVEIPPPAETIPLEDITAWLGKRVPEGWREAALRRVWSADLSIRDFVGPADYAWDWNTPGGAPGWGPIQATDDLVRALARAIGEDLPPKAKPEPGPAADEAPGRPTETPVETLVGDGASLQDPAADLPQPVVITASQRAPAPPSPRRGGRAMPV